MILEFMPSADKAVSKMPKRDAAQLLSKLKAFAADPLGSYGWTKALTGGGVRIRQGDWRAICQVNGKEMVVLVVKVGNRREVYR
jgi:mRNA interferase RelE/StbE